MKVSLFRHALQKTDKFVDVTSAGYDCPDCGGVPYRDALEGVLVVLDYTEIQRKRVLDTYDRLERYRSYCRELAYIAKHGPRKPSHYQTRAAYEAQAKVLRRIYGEYYGIV